MTSSADSVLRPSAANAGTSIADGSRHTQWLGRLARRLFILDLVLVSLAVFVAAVFRFGRGLRAVPVDGADRLPVTSYVSLCLLLVCAWLVMLYAARTYDSRVIGIGADEYKRVVRSSLWLWAAVAIICYGGRIEVARTFTAVAFPLGMVLLLTGRWAARKVLHRARTASHDWSHRVLVVGGGKEVNELVAELAREPYAGLHVVGACVPGGRSDGAASVPVVGSLSNVRQAVARTGADTVAVTASPGVSAGMLKQLGWELEGAGVHLVVAPALTDVAGPRIHVRPVSGLSLLYVEQPEFSGPSRAIKWVFDRLLALAALVIASPFLLVSALLIKVSSRGPVIFRQARIGRNGHIFTVYKLRSMVVGAEEQPVDVLQRDRADGPPYTDRADPRITPVGRWLRRFGLDELPQLFNVLLGDMSLVGPRAPLPGEIEEHGRSAARRVKVKPGITGLWKVSGRADLSWEDSVRLDLYYVENWSFAGDIQILWKTAHTVAVRRSAG
jgi:exopolysaccharide biosynthesis polyprenyl glycosylphosphotransferase